MPVLGAHPTRTHQFGSFELDPAAGELRKDGNTLKLHGQPVEILRLLLERPGEVVTREELRQKLWPDGTFVDFEHSLNAAIKRLREALEDSAETPRYVETVPRRGYRFIYPIEDQQRLKRRRGLLAVAAGALLGLAAVAWAGWFIYFRPGPALTESDYLLLADFENTTGDPVFEGTLKQALAVKVEESPFLNMVPPPRVRETLELMRRSPDEPVTGAIAQEVCQRLGVKAMLEGSIAPLGGSYVIGLNAVNCQTGGSLAREQIQAQSKEEVLQAQGAGAGQLETMSIGKGRPFCTDSRQEPCRRLNRRAHFVLR